MAEIGATLPLAGVSSNDLIPPAEPTPATGMEASDLINLKM
jgi:hypothetical protein